MYIAYCTYKKMYEKIWFALQNYFKMFIQIQININTLYSDIYSFF